MAISQQGFADAVIAYVEGSEDKLDPTLHESQVPDLWTYRAEGHAMSGSICLVHHGMFDQVYRRKVVLPGEWNKFCAQFYTPEARLLLRLRDACLQPSWLTWDPRDTGRDDASMTNNFWTRTHQNRTYSALQSALMARGMVTLPTQLYADDPDAFGVVFPGRVVDFPGSYPTLDLAIDELLTGDKFITDIPRGYQLYGDSVPVLHMIGTNVEWGDDKLTKLVVEDSHPVPKNQQVAYVLSELRNGGLITRNIGYMMASILEVAYGCVAGAIVGGFGYLVPSDLSPDEQQSYYVSESNWEMHQAGIIKRCPVIAEALADATT